MQASTCAAANQADADGLLDPRNVVHRIDAVVLSEGTATGERYAARCDVAGEFTDLVAPSADELSSARAWLEAPQDPAAFSEALAAIIGGVTTGARPAPELPAFQELVAETVETAAGRWRSYREAFPSGFRAATKEEDVRS